jgi:RNA polymerase sigma factor (sigma-70 family)
MDNKTFRSYEGMVKNIVIVFIKKYKFLKEFHTTHGSLEHNIMFDFEDLFQIGCMALLESDKSFDENFGVKFTTYAYKFIHQALYNYYSHEVKWRYRTMHKYFKFIVAEILIPKEIEVKMDKISKDAEYVLDLIYKNKIPAKKRIRKQNVYDYLRNLKWSKQKCRNIFKELQFSLYN